MKRIKMLCRLLKFRLLDISPEEKNVGLKSVSEILGKNYEEKQTNMISILHFYCTKIQQIFDHLHTSSSQRFDPCIVCCA